MKIEYDGQIFEAYLMDDGTLDTVITINGIEVRLNQEYASQYRDENGEISEENFINMVWEEIEADYEGIFNQ